MSEAEKYFNKNYNIELLGKVLSLNEDMRILVKQIIVDLLEFFHADQVKKHSLVDGTKFPKWLDNNYYLVSVDFEDFESMANKVDEFRRDLANLAKEMQDGI